MRHFYKHIFILIFIMDCSYGLYGQDTVIYRGFVSRILHESIELYPDKTFKWTSEYDLSWSEYGAYKKDEKQLILNYYIQFNYPKTMSLRDSITQFKKPLKTENFVFEKGKLFRLDNSGEKIKRKKEKSIGRWYGWIFGYNYRYEFVKTTEE